MSFEIPDRSAEVEAIFNEHFDAPKPATPMPEVDLSSVTDAQRVERCVAYLAKIPDAVANQRGHDRTFNAACETLRFGLSEADRWTTMLWFNANKCDPPWTEAELRHKLDGATEHAANEFGVRLLANMRRVQVPVETDWQRAMTVKGKTIPKGGSK